MIVRMPVFGRGIVVGSPVHLRDASYPGARKLGHGEGYVYPHDAPAGWVPQQYRPTEVEARVYSMAPLNGVWAVLPEVKSEVVVACGRASNDINPTLAEGTARRLPNARLEVWPGRGHFGPQEAPDACAASILRLANE